MNRRWAWGGLGLVALLGAPQGVFAASTPSAELRQPTSPPGVVLPAAAPKHPVSPEPPANLVQESAIGSVCAGGAITGAMMSARIGFAAGATDMTVVGAVAATSAAVGCALAIVTRGLSVNCFRGTFEFEPMGLFACTVGTIDGLLGHGASAASYHASAAPPSPAPAPPVPVDKTQRAITDDD